jgi:N-acetylneuraminate synthase
MSSYVKIENKKIGVNSPCYIIAEIGINHNGEVAIAKELIKIAAEAGCDAVKFQKRTPELCVPKNQRDVMRETPWGVMTYMEYRHRMEFSKTQYEEMASYSHSLGVQLFASAWDTESVNFLVDLGHPAIKIASASITNVDLLNKISETNLPVIMSTGMSTIQQIDDAVALLNKDKLLVAHSTSSYPCDPKELNLNVILNLRERYNVPVGYSGHEVGLQTTIGAVALGACFIERHITLDRTMWGNDQAASVEPSGLKRLVRDIRILEEAMGDGIKRVYESETKNILKLRV